ncbi:MAG: hypothetical protein H6825_16850 [Planctomycetes bacterium]|nr:hypothetical protein [Planctomycetota bacterium]
MSDPVLAFERAAFAGEADHDCELVDVDLALAAGELALLRVPSRSSRLPLADAAQGLVRPRAGRVLFEGRPWHERRPSETIAARARIGRVYEGAEWVSNLDLDENVILPACHHTRRGEEEIVAEALALARSFQLEELPAVRRPLASRVDLRALALVRALLGAPRLLLLERPLRDGAHALLAAGLAEGLRRAREGGAAVLWTTDSSAVWQDPAWEPTLRLALRDDRVVPAEQPDVHARDRR